MKIKNFLKSLFHLKYQPTKDTAIAFVLGFLVIAISFGLFLFSGAWVKGLVTLILMIILIGYLKRRIRKLMEREESY